MQFCLLSTLVEQGGIVDTQWFVIETKLMFENQDSLRVCKAK